MIPQNVILLHRSNVNYSLITSLLDTSRTMQRVNPCHESSFLVVDAPNQSLQRERLIIRQHRHLHYRPRRNRMQKRNYNSKWKKWHCLMILSIRKWSLFQWYTCWLHTWTVWPHKCKLAQRPIHECLVPNANVFVNMLHRTTNPYEACIGDKVLLGSDDLNIIDMRCNLGQMKGDESSSDVLLNASLVSLLVPSTIPS